MPIQLNHLFEDKFVRIAAGIVALVLLCKAVLIGLVDLIPEEAYYWNYSQHLDFGYLDHPPMVAWLGWLSTAVFGNTEFAVRLPAFCAWLILALFMFRLTRDILGRQAAYGCLILLAVLPIYWSVGFVMTPDAPLYAAWAAVLYYAHRALVDLKPRAWIGVGIGLGLGLLSKYTMVLLGGAIFAFLLADRSARKSLTTPGPYLAAIIAAVLFMPVVIWNFQNGLSSFAYQSSQRWSLGSDFNLHTLLGSALILLTPLGLWEAFKVIVRLSKSRRRKPAAEPSLQRNTLFALVFCGIPLSVFVVHSLFNLTKLNWTGPVWLAVLPWIADRMIVRSPVDTRSPVVSIRRVWAVSVAFLVAFYPAALLWLLLGAPGMPTDSWHRLPIAWEEFSREIERVESTIERETGVEPLVVGMDKYWIASQASFYDIPDEDSLVEFAGRNVVGRSALMWSEWVQADRVSDRTMILVGFEADDLEKRMISGSFSTLGPIVTQKITRGSREAGRFYWRQASAYTPPAG
ncbi:MAG TPA: glycosyltransferase family 39 protein [Acidobacteriota bacterium]|nr:glycosyltransferase family 39 protein [Acidobacteriota bacterium]